jgi:hypothetical protein
MDGHFLGISSEAYVALSKRVEKNSVVESFPKVFVVKTSQRGGK